MPDDPGAPPKSGWARLVPELLVTDFDASLAFWSDVLGFGVAYARLDERFVYLERPEGAQVMLHQRNDVWETGPMQKPFGQGVMFQVYLHGLDAVLAALSAAGRPLYHPLREVWRRTGDHESGQRELFVQDPDGYLIMVAENIGQRPVAS
jgi:catechol 2,3-dioxygenase-like lactoylglutathione lyase family enzyme